MPVAHSAATEGIAIDAHLGSSACLQQQSRGMFKAAAHAAQVSIARVYNYDVARKRGLQKEGQASQK